MLSMLNPLSPEKKVYIKAFIEWKKQHLAKCPDGYYLQQILELEITP